MAVLFITEFVDMVQVSNKQAQMAKQPPIAEQTVAIGGASVASAAFNAKTNYIRVHTDAICSVSVGSAPVATATKARMAAGQTEYFCVNPTDKIAVITNV